MECGILAALTSRSAQQHQEASKHRSCQYSRVSVSNTTAYLALQELQAGAATSADMAQLIFRVVLSNDSRGIATADNDGSTVLRSLYGSVQK